MRRSASWRLVVDVRGDRSLRTSREKRICPQQRNPENNGERREDAAEGIGTARIEVVDIHESGHPEADRQSEHETKNEDHFCRLSCHKRRGSCDRQSAAECDRQSPERRLHAGINIENQRDRSQATPTATTR
ncbi:MAG: hypothetical protein HC895_11565 [Leptolyngbyaceae cyanobacterium SM1_3_5]|nr:hypothetical protein [Leptolyngbyaceae cyanobacterium SM1_3_5]